MPNLSRHLPLAIVAALVLSLASSPAAAGPAGRPVKVLLTVDGSHNWAAKEPLFQSLVKDASGFEVETTGDLNRWLPGKLAGFDLVVVHTTGGSLTDEQAKGLREFLEAGGGFAGIHCATDSFKNSDAYWQLVGGRFTGHGGGKYNVDIIDPHHPVVAGMTSYAIEDEDYQHAYHPKADIRVLARKAGDDRNMVWVKRVGKGRLFYIANGDNPGVFKNEAFRTLLLRGMQWAAGRRVPAPHAGEEGFRPLFDGKTLEGWEGDAKLWVAEDGLLIGRSPGINYNDFLSTKGEWEDFELKLQFRMVNGVGNSGVQIRSKRIPSHVSGYQADLGETYWGCLYDEARRNRVLQPAAKELARVLEMDGWNEYWIRCEKERVTLKINGLTTVDYREEDSSIPRKGIIALQIHAGAAMEIQFADIRLRPLGQ